MMATSEITARQVFTRELMARGYTFHDVFEAFEKERHFMDEAQEMVGPEMAAMRSLRRFLRIPPNEPFESIAGIPGVAKRQAAENHTEMEAPSTGGQHNPPLTPSPQAAKQTATKEEMVARASKITDALGANNADVVRDAIYRYENLRVLVEAIEDKIDLIRQDTDRIDDGLEKLEDRFNKFMDNQAFTGSPSPSASSGMPPPAVPPIGVPDYGGPSMPPPPTGAPISAGGAGFVDDFDYDKPPNKESKKDWKMELLGMGKIMGQNIASSKNPIALAIAYVLFFSVLCMVFGLLYWLVIGGGFDRIFG